MHRFPQLRAEIVFIFWGYQIGVSLSPKLFLYCPMKIEIGIGQFLKGGSSQ